MYAKKNIARRRATGWADRRRYYRHLFEQAPPKAVKHPEAQKAAPVIEKD